MSGISPTASNTMQGLNAFSRSEWENWCSTNRIFSKLTKVFRKWTKSNLDQYDVNASMNLRENVLATNALNDEIYGEGKWKKPWMQNGPWAMKVQMYSMYTTWHSSIERQTDHRVCVCACVCWCVGGWAVGDDYIWC